MHPPALKPARFFALLPVPGRVPTSHLRRLRLVLRLLVGLLPLATLGGCSRLLARHVPGRIDSLTIRHHRADVVAELGAPRRSVTFSPPAEAPALMFPPAGKAVRRDEYQVSGLRLSTSDSAAMRTKPYSTDLSDEQRAILEPLLPARLPDGRPREVDLREVVNAIFYKLKHAVIWSDLPRDLPAHGTVFDYYAAWTRPGLPLLLVGGYVASLFLLTP